MSNDAILAVGIAFPDFVPKEELILGALGSNDTNTSQASAHSEVVQERQKAFNNVPEIVGNLR